MSKGLTASSPVIGSRRVGRVVLLTVLTLGVYFWFWCYRINCEMRGFGARHGDDALASIRPWRSTLALTVGSLLVIPALVSAVAMVTRVQAAERVAGADAGPAAGVMAVLIAGVLLPLGASVHHIGLAFSLAGLAALAAASGLIQARLNAVGALELRAEVEVAAGDADLILAASRVA